MNILLPHIELPFFTNLLILLVSAKLLGEIFERFKQPAMIGEIIAGIILSPSLFNIIHRTEDIKVISELGVFLLVIIAGLEINIEDIYRSIKGKNIIISILAFTIPILSGFAVGYFFHQDIMTTIFIGLCVAITALPVSIRILMDLGIVNSEIGRKIISIAIFDDVLALTILGVILHVKDTDMSIAAIVNTSFISFLKLSAFMLIMGICYLLIKKYANRGNYIENNLNKLISQLKGKETLFALFFIFILIFSTITETLGFHFIIGAFFASMLISKSIIGENNLNAVHKSTNSLAMGFLAPIFFAGIGLEFNFSSLENYGLLISVVAVSYFSKIIGGYLGARFAGIENTTSFLIGIGLNARGIMELVIANIAYKAELINTEVFSILVIMGVLTTISTPFMLKMGLSKFGKLPTN